MEPTRKQKQAMIQEYTTTWTTIRKLSLKYDCPFYIVRKMMENISKCNPPYIQRHIKHLEEAEELCRPLPNETFKEHPYHKGIWVSNLGRVVNRRMPYPHLRVAVVCRPCPYKSIILNPGRIRIYIHTLVAETFISERPKERSKSGKRPLYTVSHLDNDPTNNRADNLIWETLKNNLHRSPKWTGNLKNGEHRGRPCKLSLKQAQAIREERKQGISVRDLSKKYKVSDSTVYSAINRTECHSVN